MSVAVHQNVDNLVVNVAEERTTELPEHFVRLLTAKRFQGDETPVIL